MRKFGTRLLALAAVAALGLAWAAGPAGSAHAAEKKKEKRQKTLEFGDGLIEGTNKGPSDYASTAAKYKDRKRAHLYRKEISFEKDLEETLGEMRYSQ